MVSEVKQTNSERKEHQTDMIKWQTRAHSRYKAPKLIGLKMQAYTSSSRTGERR